MQLSSDERGGNNMRNAPNRGRQTAQSDNGAEVVASKAGAHPCCSTISFNLLSLFTHHTMIIQAYDEIF
jgi:hypothetical protein